MNGVAVIKILLVIFTVLTVGFLFIPEQDKPVVEAPVEQAQITAQNTPVDKPASPKKKIATVDTTPITKPVTVKKDIVKKTTTTKPIKTKKKTPKVDKPKVAARPKSKPRVKKKPQQKAIVYAHAGVILFANGHVTAKSLNGKSRTLKRGSEVKVGDIVTTGKSSQAQIRAGDGSMFSLNANSKLKIIEHQYTGDVEKQSSVIELVKGGMRAVTGLIGKNKPENFKIKVKQATIGIRGTEFIVQVCDNDCNKDAGKSAGSPSGNGVYVGVLSGAVEVEQKEQKVNLDASLNVVMGVSMGIDKSKKQYLFIGEKKDAKVKTLEKPPEVILLALAPPPVKLSKQDKKKKKTHSLSPYSGVDTRLYAAHMDATNPVEKPLSATEKFDQLAYPGAPDVFVRQRFIMPVYYGRDVATGEILNLNEGRIIYYYFYPPPP